MSKKRFTTHLIERILLIFTLIFLLFANYTFANNLSSGLGYDSRWVKVGNDWKVLNCDGTFLSNCWFFDTVQSKWYRIGSLNDEVLTGATGYYNASDASSMIAGLWTEKNTNKSYFFDNFSSLTYGSLIDKNGYYTINGKSIYLEFEQSDVNSKGSITVGLSELKTVLNKSNEVLIPVAGTGGSSSGGSDSGGGNVKPIAPKVKRTILLYIIGSDLEERSLVSSVDIYKISRYNYPSDIRVLVFTGGSRMDRVEKARKNNKYPALEEVFKINWEKNQIWEARNGINLIEDNFGNKSMTDENTLLDLLNYIKKYYPSEEYNIILNDHGAGANGGLGEDKRKNIEKTTPLSLLEIKNSFDKSGLKFGFIGFDACFMGNIEYLYGFSDYADYYIGSAESEAGSWKYEVFETLAKNPNISYEDFSKNIIDTFIKAKNSNSNTLAVFDLKKFKDDVKNGLSKFAKTIYDLSLKDFYSLKELVHTRVNSIEYGIEENYDFVDLYDFVVNIDNSTLPNDIKIAATDLWEAVSKHIIYYDTNRPKDDGGHNRTGGISMYFPLVCLDMDKKENVLISFYDSLGETYNKDCNEMLKSVFTRMSLAKVIVESSEYTDDKAIKELDTKVLEPSKKYLALRDDEINKIKDNVYPDLLRYRLYNHDTANYSLERSGRIGELIIRFKKYLNTYLDEIYAEPMIYDGTGKELRLGHVTIPHTFIEEDDEIYWNISPREACWFTLSDGNVKNIVSFYPTETEITNSDYVSENYLFDKTITGYIPAVKIVKDSEGDEDEEPILIYARFEELNNRAEILGYRYFNITDKYEPSKALMKFENGEKIKPIYNFEDAKKSKEISDKGKQFDAEKLKVTRGNIDEGLIYYDYNILDEFNQKTKVTIDKKITFKDTSHDTKFFMDQYETWYNYIYKVDDNSMNMWSEIEGHKEDISIIVNTIPSGNSIYNDFSGYEKSFSDESISYFRQRDFDNKATSSIIISQQELTAGLLMNFYLLKMESSKNIEGVDCKYSKLYFVYPKRRVMYLFDITLYNSDGVENYNINKMINYVSTMIENQLENYRSDTEIIIKPLDINQTNNTNPLNENEIIVSVATESDIVEQIATDSEISETTKETTEVVIEETKVEISEEFTKETIVETTEENEGETKVDNTEKTTEESAPETTKETTVENTEDATTVKESTEEIIVDNTEDVTNGEETTKVIIVETTEETSEESTTETVEESTIDILEETSTGSEEPTTETSLENEEPSG